MNWTIEYSDDPEAFKARVRDFLLEDEALHNVALGVLRTLQQNPDYYSGDNMLACVQDGGNIGGVVTRTPPFPGLLSRAVDEEAVSAMVEALLDTYSDLDGIIGPKESVEIAVRRLDDLGFDCELEQRQRLYRTTTVEPPTGVPGEMRTAMAQDRELLETWFTGFAIEAEGQDEDEAKKGAASKAEFFIEQEAARLWVAGGGPVCVAAIAGRSPNGLRIGYVYTPPNFRENGYASALTAALTQEALEAGCEHCFLYADLDNPTTNRIYPAIGYEPVADQYRYGLTPSQEEDG
jgi:hypothetical protein